MLTLDAAHDTLGVGVGAAPIGDNPTDTLLQVVAHHSPDGSDWSGLSDGSNPFSDCHRLTENEEGLECAEDEAAGEHSHTKNEGELKNPFAEGDLKDPIERWVDEFAENSGEGPEVKEVENHQEEADEKSGSQGSSDLVPVDTSQDDPFDLELYLATGQYRYRSESSSSDNSERDHQGLAWCYDVQLEATFRLPTPNEEEIEFLGSEVLADFPLPSPVAKEKRFFNDPRYNDHIKFDDEDDDHFQTANYPNFGLVRSNSDSSDSNSEGENCLRKRLVPRPLRIYEVWQYESVLKGPFSAESILSRLPDTLAPFSDNFSSPLARAQAEEEIENLRQRVLYYVGEVEESKKEYPKIPAKFVKRIWVARLASSFKPDSENMSVILCTAGYDHTIRFWEALSGICSRTIQHSDSQVNRLCISPDKRFLAAAGRIDVKLYDIKSTNPNPVLTFEGHKGNVTGVGFHCEGKWMVTSSEDCTVKIWDTRTGSEQRNYDHGKDNGVNDVVIHPNQGELISCDQGGNVRIWDLGENKCTHQLIPEDEVPVRSVSVASDGSMLIAGNNLGNIFVWRMIQNRDVTSLVPITKFQAHHKYITRVLLSPDVRHLATCSADHTAKIWAVDPVAMSTMTAANSTTTTVTDNAGNNTLVHTTTHALPGTSAPGAAPGTPGQPNAFPLEATLHQHQRWVWDCAFSADSAYLVTACSDHYARLWELSSQQIIRQYNGHHRGAVCVALNDYSER